jgi:hypothetical protein
MNPKEIITKLSSIIIVIFVLCDLTTARPEAFQAVPGDKVPDILNTISNHVHENFRLINTWQAETQVSRYVVYKGEKAKDIFIRNTDAVGEAPNTVAEIHENQTTFSCDLDKGLFYTKNQRTTPKRYIDPVSGKDLGTKSSPSWYRIAILTPAYYLQSMPNRIRDGHIVDRRAVREKVDKDCPSCEPPSVVDPRDLFDARSPVWLSYPRIVERIRERGKYVLDDKYALKVERQELEGDVQYRIHQPAKIRPEGGNVWFIKTFSSSAGYNVTSFRMISVTQGLMHKRNLEYQLLEGIYVPSKATEENFDLENGSLQYRKVRIFKNVRLNHPIPLETFTYNNLGLEDGDDFEDRILDKKYVYRQRELVEVPKPK